MVDFDEFLDPVDWDFPVPIYYGPGRISEIAELCTRCGVTAPLVVTDRASRALPFVSSILERLRTNGLNASVFSDIAPNPTDENVTEGVRFFREGGFDGIIALGGGSGMDAGKAISLLVRNDHALWEFDFDNPTQPDLSVADFVPLICVPTTAGTGAETESTAMITDTGRGVKGCVWHVAQKPKGVILDPELTVGLPRNLTAWTGCDALVHAIEAYCVDMVHPMCDGIACEALGLIYRALPKVLEEPANIGARGAMLVGSCLAGVSFLKGLGLVHAISHMVGAEHDTHHGLTNAVILPVVLDFNSEAIAGKLPGMCHAMGVEAQDYQAFRKAVTGLLDTCEIPRALSEILRDAPKVGRLAEKAFKDVAASTNPRRATVGDIENLIRSALQGARA